MCVLLHYTLSHAVPLKGFRPRKTHPDGKYHLSSSRLRAQRAQNQAGKARFLHIPPATLPAASHPCHGCSSLALRAGDGGGGWQASQACAALLCWQFWAAGQDRCSSYHLQPKPFSLTACTWHWPRGSVTGDHRRPAVTLRVPPTPGYLSLIHI